MKCIPGIVKSIHAQNLRYLVLKYSRLGYRLYLSWNIPDEKTDNTAVFAERVSTLRWVICQLNDSGHRERDCQS